MRRTNRMMSLTYMTRKCAYKCDYCTLVRNDMDKMSPDDWIKAFAILNDMGVEFNLILGNEPWLLGDELPRIMETNQVPFAMYSACNPVLFERYRDKMFKVIDNLSCGIDYPPDYLDDLQSRLLTRPPDDVLKGINGWKAFKWTREFAPHVDVQGTVTVHNKNLHLVKHTVMELNAIGAHAGVNFVHYDKDGQFDFFPKFSDMLPYIIPESRFDEVEELLQWIRDTDCKVHNRESLTAHSAETLNRMGWHCNGDPYGGPTVDADGQLRVCGYRRGTETPKYHIFDLTDKTKKEKWKKAVYDDAMACPGCAWSCSMMYKHLTENDKANRQGVMINHEDRKSGQSVERKLNWREDQDEAERRLRL